MRVTGPRVVAAWGLFNGALLAIHAGYGGGEVPTFPFAIYGSAIGTIELFALTVFWVYRTGRTNAWFSPAPSMSHAALTMAVMGGFIGAGLIYRPWMMAPAVYPLLILLKTAVSALARESEPEPLPSQEAPPETPAQVAYDTAVTAVAAVGTFAVARSVLRRLRPARRGERQAAIEAERVEQ